MAEKLSDLATRLESSGRLLQSTVFIDASRNCLEAAAALRSRDEAIEGLRELSERATAGPWVYRPNDYDDWGFIRTAAPEAEELGLKPLVAISRSGPIGDIDFNAHRDAKTDPYGPNAAFIVACVNHIRTALAASERDTKGRGE